MGWHGEMVLGGGFMWIFWILLIVGVVAVISALPRKDRPEEREFHPSPVDILKERYARGEINRDEYERSLKDLQDW